MNDLVRFSSLQSITTPRPETARTQSAPLTGGLPEVGALGGHSVQVVEQAEPQLAGEVLATRPRSAPQIALGAARIVATDPSARDLATEALPSRDMLIDRMGAPPKKDVSFLGMKVHTMATGYKDVLAKLDAYHAAVAACRPGTPERGGAAMQIEDAQAVSKALDQLETAITAYTAVKKHTHKAPMEQLLAQVRGEKSMVQGVLAAVHSQPGRPTVALSDAFAFRRVQTGLTLDEIGGLKAKGYSASDYRQIWSMTLEPKGLRPGDVHTALAQGLPLATIRAYHEARLPITEQTQVRQCKDQNLTTDMTLLGKGGFNAVYRAQYASVGGAPPLDGVFKREVHGLQAGAAKATGIDLENPRWACRNVASHRLDARLGLGLTAPTEFATHNGQLGTVMGMARGQSPITTGTTRIPLPPEQAAYLRAHPEALEALKNERGFASVTLEGDTLKAENKVQQIKTYEADDGMGHLAGDPVMDAEGHLVYEAGDGETLVAMNFGDPVLRRELTKLQWFDALTGQVDRHAHNYFVQRDGAGAVTGITAIDNDCAFGAKLTNPNAIEEGTFKAMLTAQGERPGTSIGLRGTVLPEVVDRQTYTALMALTAEDVADTIGGMLTPEEVNATQQRLDAIQTKLRTLEEQGHVVDNLDDWRSETTTRLLGVQDVGAQVADIRARGALAGASESDMHYDIVRTSNRTDAQCTSASYVARETVTQDRTRLGQTPLFRLLDIPPTS